MTVFLSPLWGAGAQIFDDNGVILTGGKIYTYVAGTSTPAATYTSSTGVTAHSNPIILDAAGRVADEVWLTNSVNYKFILKDSNDVLIGTYDNLTGINSTINASTIAFTGVKGQTGTLSDLGTMNGSNYVGFQPAGGGALSASYSIQDKLRQYVSVTDFGADSTGVNDSTSAFVNALLAAKDIYVPEGTYKITSAILIPPYGVIRGAGVHNTSIVAANNNVAFILQYWSQLHQLSVSKTGVHGKNLIEVGSATLDAGRAVISDVRVDGAGADGIQLIYGNLGLLQNITSVGNGLNGIRFLAGNGDLNAWTVQGYIDLRANGNDGFRIEGGASLSDPLCSKSNFISGVTSQENTQFGVYIGTRSNLVSCYAESNGSSDVYLGPFARGNEVKTTQGSVLDASANPQFNIVYNYNAIAGYQRIFQNLTYFSGKNGAGLGIFNDDGTVGGLKIQKLADKSFGITGAFSGSNQTLQIASESFPGARLDLTMCGHIIPGIDNNYNLGSGTFRWATIYAANGTINTSDANKKEQIADLTEQEKAVARLIRKQVKKFKFKDAVALKGDKARIHVGVLAQEVAQVFADNGLDAHNYGMFCSDTAEDGSVTLGIRYDELLAFIISAM